MWQVEQTGGAVRAATAAVYVAAVLAFLAAQELGLRLRDEEQREWWAGSGRDLLNLAGWAAIAGALRLVGLGWPAATLVGGTVALLLFGVATFVQTQTHVPHARAWAIGIGLALALPVAFFPDEVVGAFGRVASRLFALGPP